MSDCVCSTPGREHCEEGERLYQADREADEAEIDAKNAHDANPSDYTIRELRAAQDAYTEARKAWLNHRNTRDSERFMERVREWKSSP